MHSVWVIFKKDVRRLWWQIAASLGLLAVLVHNEAYRGDIFADPVERWAEVVIPLVWALLVAQAIHGEILLGDSEFWMTRPYRPWQLLASKALFAVVFVHLPALLADCVIISSRSLWPFASVSHILVKQVLLAVAITLPSIALAAVLRNLMQFVFIAVVAPVVVLWLYNPLRFGWMSLHYAPRAVEDPLRPIAAVLIAAAAAFAMVLLQFLARRTWWSRGIGAAGAGAATSFLILASPSLTLSLQAIANPANARISVELDPSRSPHLSTPFSPRFQPDYDAVAISVPISLSGIPANAMYRYTNLSCELSGPNGAHYRYAPKAPSSRRPDFSGGLILLQNGPSVSTDTEFGPILHLMVTRKLYDAMQNSPATISGRALLQFYTVLPASYLRPGMPADIPGVGRCMNTLQDGVYTAAAYLKVECESANGPIPDTQVKLQSPHGNPAWTHSLTEAFFNNTPRMPWLSLVERRQTSFALVDGKPEAPGAQWLVPRDALQDAQIEITPVHVIGYTILDYHFPNLHLQDIAPPKH